MAKLTPEEVAFYDRWEGNRLVAYDDAQPDKVLRQGDAILGTLTIGRGHTGPDVYIGQTITEAQSLALLQVDVDEAAAAVDAAVEPPLTRNQMAALVSLVFNIGETQFRSSTVLRKLNKDDIAGAAAAFLLWNKTTIGGKKVVSNGLKARRAAEMALFLTPDAVERIDHTITPDKVTPSASVGEKIAKGTAAGAAAAGGIGAGVKAANDALFGLPWWGVALGLVLIVAVGASAVFVVRRKR